MRRSFRLLLCLVVSVVFSFQVALAEMPKTPFFPVNDSKSILNYVSAVTGNKQFANEVRTSFKQRKIDIDSVKAPEVFQQGNQIFLSGLSEPLVMGTQPHQFSYKGISFDYDTKVSFEKNIANMKKVWGSFSELGWETAKTSWLFGTKASADVGPQYMWIARLIGVAASVAVTVAAAAAWGVYKGYQWWTDSKEPFKVELKDGKCIRVKGDSKMVVAMNPVDGPNAFFTEVDGKRDLEGELSAGTTFIKNPNAKAKALKSSDQTEILDQARSLRKVCLSQDTIKSYNDIELRKQRDINSGLISTPIRSHSGQVVPQPPAPAANAPAGAR